MKKRAKGRPVSIYLEEDVLEKITGVIGPSRARISRSMLINTILRSSLDDYDFAPLWDEPPRLRLRQEGTKE